MKYQFKNSVVALVITVAAANAVNAQQHYAQVGGETQANTIQYVQPPQQQNMYYFGLSIELKRDWHSTTLRVVSVTPGSPAARAGLEFGDEIRTVNGRGFEHAHDSFQAVSMMNQFVNSGSAPAPAAVATAATAYYIAPPQPTAQMVVRNVRDGHDVYVTVNPQRRGGFPGPAPAAAAASVAAGG